MEEFELPVVYDELAGWSRRAVREQYVKEQGGKCMYCEGDLSEEPGQEVKMLSIDWDLFPDDFLKYPIHLQHDHDTGLTEGAVHAYCNAIMWQYEGR